MSKASKQMRKERRKEIMDTTHEANLLRNRIGVLEGYLGEVCDRLDGGHQVPLHGSLHEDIRIALNRKEPTEEDRRREVQEAAERGFHST